MSIDAKDLLVTIKSYHRGEALPLDSSEVQDSYEKAMAYAANSGAAYAGQTIKALVNGRYVSYVLQPKSNGGYELSKVGVDASEIKTAVRVVDSLPENDMEQGVLYVNISDKKGYIYTGTTYQQVFEQVDGLFDRISTTEAQIAIINGTEDGSIAKALSDANSYADSVNKDVQASLGKKADKDSVYTKTETDENIAAAIANSEHLKRQIVDALPSSTDADVNTIYMVKRTQAQEDNVYEEYMVFSDENNVKHFEKVGDTEIDLSDYATKEDVSAAKEEAVSASKELDATVKKEVTDAIATEVTQALSDAKDYADKQNATTLANAKEYADSLSSNYDKAGAANDALVAAKEYADQQDTTNLAAAKQYMDDQSSAVTKVLDTKADTTYVTTALDNRLGDIDSSTTVKDYIDVAIGSGGTSSAEAIAKAKKEAIETSEQYTDNALTITEF